MTTTTKSLPISKGTAAALLADIVAWSDEDADHNYLLRYLRQTIRKAETVPSGKSHAAWMPRIQRLMAKWAIPLTPEEEADPCQLQRPNSEVRTRTLATLFRFLILVPQMPDPDMSPDGEGGIEVGWRSSDLSLKVCFIVRPGGVPISCWGRFHGDDKSWKGTVDNSEKNIKRALSLLAAE